MTAEELYRLYQRCLAIYNREGRITTRLVQKELKTSYARAEALVKQVRQAALTLTGV